MLKTINKGIEEISEAIEKDIRELDFLKVYLETYTITILKAQIKEWEEAIKNEVYKDKLDEDINKILEFLVKRNKEIIAWLLDEQAPFKELENK